MGESKSFYLPTHVITGLGCSQQLGARARALGQRALLVCSRGAAPRSGFLDPLRTSLGQAGVDYDLYARVQGEPTLQVVAAGIDLVRQRDHQVLIGLGGGSAMDTAKAIAGLALLPGRVDEYHQGRKLDGPSLPLITVPTTAGSGAEVTKNAVLSDPARNYKASIRTDDWFARVALVDPELTRGLPPSVTASSGSDALCQAIEAYVSTGASPVTDGLAGEAIRLIGRSLAPAFRNGDDLDARSDMLYGSLLAGMALANARLGGAHGLAHPLGIRFGIPHGTICGLLLPHVMAHSLPWAEAKYAQVAQWLGADVTGLSDAAGTGWSGAADAQQAVELVRRLLVEIDLPLRLRDLGVAQADFPLIIEESLPSGSLKHNPRPLGASDLQAILSAAW